MPTKLVSNGDTLSSFAGKVFNGDWERFPELLELNPKFDVFADLIPNTPINIPDIDQVFQFANTELGSITSGINQLEKYTKDIPILSGYAKQALEKVGEINGTISKAESIYKKVKSSGRNYEDATQLVSWLLGKNI